LRKLIGKAKKPSPHVRKETLEKKGSGFGERASTSNTGANGTRQWDSKHGIGNQTGLCEERRGGTGMDACAVRPGKALSLGGLGLEQFGWA